jgi:hypothetical protein
MHNTRPDIAKINELAWVLSLASAKKILDVPGEYIWAFPANDRFHEVRSRSRSIFSSGNSIKDPEVIEFVQNCDINRHLLNPWIVKELESEFPKWIKSGHRYRLTNLDLFKYVGFSAGTQESFINYYLFNKDRRFRVFRGDYWWHMEIWSRTGIQWCYLEDDDLRPGDTCIVSYPFALTGDKHPQLDSLIQRCCEMGIPMLLDFIYLPNSDQAVDIDLSADCIRQITFSFSKTFPVQCAKIAIRMCKDYPNDPMQMSNDENICNRLSAGLALEIIQKFTVDYNVIKYKHSQARWCQYLGLSPTKVVHFAIGDDYTNYGKQGSTAWCSPFNNQQNRYNLGMLFENEKILASLGYRP